VLLPEFDDRAFHEHVLPKIMSVQGKFDVVFHHKHQGAEVSEWGPEDEQLPQGQEPYYLKFNTGPRWLLGGVISRPFITTKQSEGKFAISSIESSSRHEKSNPFAKQMSFPNVHHCLTMFEGALEVRIAGAEPCRITEGETLFLPAGTKFSLHFVSKFVRVWSFTSGDGIEALVHEAGKPWQGYVVPDTPSELDEKKFETTCKKYNVDLS